MTRCAVPAKMRPMVVQRTSCMPTEASRKRNSVTAGNVLGTSWTEGRAQPAAITIEQVRREREQGRRRVGEALCQELAQANGGDGREQ